MPPYFTVINTAGLSPEERDVLWGDLRNVAVEESYDLNWVEERERAERVLLMHLGGQGNVRSYVDCLMAGRRRSAE